MRFLRFFYSNSPPKKPFFIQTHHQKELFLKK